MYRFKQTKIFNFYMMNGTINKYLIAEIICNNSVAIHTYTLLIFKILQISKKKINNSRKI